MKRKSLLAFFVVPLLLIMSGISMAGVNVNLNIGPPPVYTFSEPPELVVIPNTYVYFAPGADLDIVFYHGFWYRPYNGYWYRGTGYNGPWHHIGRERVPRYILNLPPDYRRSYRDYPRIPYGHVHDNWNRWERERYWNKRQWKYDQNEWKHERHEDRREQHREMKEERHDKHEQKHDQHQEMKQERRDHKQEKHDQHRSKRNEGKEKKHEEK